MKIQLTCGKYALVDKENYEALNNYHWWFDGRYAVSNKMINLKSTKIYMHRLLWGNPKNRIDHINGDKLDNRIKNLRVCTQAENTANAKKKCTSTNKYKGICKHNDKWVARITKKYKLIYLGIYKTQKEAAKRYNEEAIKLFGEFARLNKI